ncbi:MAG: HAD hydrolase family protein [Lachnospiraceae bacterium]|nr:HAD hydrolase family protein [Lachnospiraceae bacterium]
MNKKVKFKLPGIGMRIVKSAIAVAVCYLINMLRNGQGMVFYSQLAALWCIQMYRANTKQNAVQRTIGTVVGAIYGLIYILINPFISNTDKISELLGSMIISVMIVIVLYTTVLLKQRQASYFSCVVFLSIVVNHMGDVNPYMFVWNRFLDTMIGIAVGLIINDIRLSLHPNRDTLFISGIDGLLLDKKEMLSPFSKVELNRMIDDGMKFTVSTMRTPASIIEPMKEVRLKLPVIAMNGAVLYDTTKHSYIKAYVISGETSKKLVELIESEKLNFYSNVIIDDMLVIYYKETEDPVNKDLVKTLRTSPYRNYVMRPLPDDEAVVYFMLLDKKEKVSEFYKRLENEGFTSQLRIITYDSDDYPGYAYIKIYNKNATKENMIKYLKEFTSINDVITFGSIEGQYDVYIDTDDANKVVKEVRKRYEPIKKSN